ncbi:MAG: hypothetical protein IH987_17650 [Planctomycetes bacterium]|nr:hypothetical protein [Planctomycetota bacterium]
MAWMKRPLDGQRRQSRRFRRVRVVCSILGLIVIGGAWSTAVLIDKVRPNGNSCYSFGYGHGDAWLLGVMVYPDGFVLVQYFDQNLSRHTGLYRKMSRANTPHRFTLRDLLPKSLPRGRYSGSTGYTFHLIVPLLFFFLLATYSLGMSRFRQRHRRKRGLCLRCGYNLAGNVSGVCPECGEST